MDNFDDRLAEKVAALLPRLGMMVVKAHACQSAAAGITVGHYKALGFLFHHGQCTVGEIAAGLCVSLSTASELLDQLVTSGYVERGTNPADRRQVHVWLTAAGKAITDELYQRRIALVRAALHEVPPAERPIVVRSLETLLTVLLRQLDSVEPAATPRVAPKPTANQ